jgi:hypothetical protein
LGGLGARKQGAFAQAQSEQVYSQELEHAAASKTGAWSIFRGKGRVHVAITAAFSQAIKSGKV